MKSPVRKYFFVVSFILITVLINAQQIVVSVSDFSVESKKEEYTFIGKGISTLVAGELRRTKAVKLLERSKMNKIMEEQKLSLTGLVDENSQVELGKLLAADYIIFGEIIDMGRSLLISARMADVTTGEVVWEDSLTEKLETYDFIGAYLAKSVLTELNLDVTKDISAKVENKVEKEPEAIVALSKGVDAYDKGDEEKAKEELKTAKKLDPENEVASYFLAKLVTNTTKFKVITTPFYSYQNPAYLGILKTDRLHTNSSMQVQDLIAMFAGGDVYTEVGNTGKGIREYDGNYSLGYYFPAGDNMGFGVELFQSIIRNDMNDSAAAYDEDGDVYAGTFGQGGMGSFGIRVSETVSLGISSAVFGLTNYHPLFAPYDESSGEPKRNETAFSVLGGILYKNMADTLYFDLRAGYCSATYDILDIETVSISDDRKMIPMVIESTLTLSNSEKSTFVILKNINDLYLDQNQYNIRLLPAAEHFFSQSFSVRGGLEGALLLNGSSVKSGWGILSGTTFRFLKSGIEIDLNLTYRRQPARSVKNFLLTNIPLSINITFNDLFISRK